MIKQKIIMLRNFISLILSLFFIPLSFSQSCLPHGITFGTQEEIDSFQSLYPYCSIIEGDVIIYGDSISNLNGLNSITNINGSLWLKMNEQLHSLEGLTNLNKNW